MTGVTALLIHAALLPGAPLPAALDQDSERIKGRWVLVKFIKSGVELKIPDKLFLLVINDKFAKWSPWTPGDLDAQSSAKFSYRVDPTTRPKSFVMTQFFHDIETGDVDDIHTPFAYTLTGNTLTVTLDSKNGDTLTDKTVSVKGDTLWTAVYERQR